MHSVQAQDARIPLVGLGTWQLRGDTCIDIVGAALQAGYRHVDTAAMYGNEAEVGEGVRGAGVAREDIFLTTKVWQDDLGAKDFRRSVENSLKAMQLPSVDLLLIHWPSPRIPLKETIGALLQAKRDGLTRHVGVSNFTVALLDEVAALTDELVVNQIELHPFLDATAVRAACRRHNLAVTAYCPIARGNSAGDATLTRIGKQHGKSAAQVSLRFLVQQDIIVIPRTSKVTRLKENLDIFDFTLSPAEMAEIAKLARRGGRVVTGSFAPAWD